MVCLLVQSTKPFSIDYEHCPSFRYFDRLSPKPQSFCTWIYRRSDSKSTTAVEYNSIEKVTFSRSIQPCNRYNRQWSIECVQERLCLWREHVICLNNIILSDWSLTMKGIACDFSLSQFINLKWSLLLYLYNLNSLQDCYF